MATGVLVLTEFERILGTTGVLFMQSLKNLEVPWCSIFYEVEKISGAPGVLSLTEFKRILSSSGVSFLKEFETPLVMGSRQNFKKILEALVFCSRKYLIELWEL